LYAAIIFAALAAVVPHRAIHSITIKKKGKGGKYGWKLAVYFTRKYPS
jgi:hypothetical protein